MRYWTDVKDADWMEMVEGYELSDGSTVFVAVEFKFDTAEGLTPVRRVYIDEAGYTIDVEKYSDFEWLFEAVRKDVKRFADSMYEEAETEYIRSRVPDDISYYKDRREYL